VLREWGRAGWESGEASHSFGRGRRGQSVVEFALVLPVLLLLLVTAIDFGRAYHAYTALENAVRVGGTYATVNATALDYGSTAERIADIKSKIVAACDLSPALDPSNVSIQEVLADPTNPQEGDSATISAVYQFPLITPLARSLVGGGSLRLQYTLRVSYG